MPSGRVHNLINTATYGVIAVAAVWATHQQLIVITPVQGLAFSAAYAAGTFLLSPDLDLAEGRVDSKRRWGVLGFIWVPYGRMFSHRGLSHTWLLGPLTRLVYLGLLILVLWALLSAVWPAVKWPPMNRSEFDLAWLLPLAMGYYVSQWLHLIADGVRPDHGMRRSQQKFRHLRAHSRRMTPRKSGHRK